MHLSRSTFVGMDVVGFWRLPATFHVTYCGRKVSAGEVGEEAAVDRDECLQSLMWEEIDKDTAV